VRPGRTANKVTFGQQVYLQLLVEGIDPLEFNELFQGILNEAFVGSTSASPQ
jgi:hypothetical protein